MSVYSVAIFLHVVGALALFGGVAVELVSLVRLAAARTITQAREWLSVLAGLRRLDMSAGVLILASGTYMLVARSVHGAWIGVSLAGMILMAALAAGVRGRRANALRQLLAAGEGPISSGVQLRLRDSALRTSASLRVAIGLGIVYNMCAKPAGLGAVFVMLAALAVGTAFALVRAPERGRLAASP